MPYLDRTLPVARNAVGFELPIFRMFRGANADLVQRISKKGTVERFQSCWLDTRHAVEVSDLEVSADEGDPALWAFRNEKRDLIVGTKDELVRYGIKALQLGSLKEHPVTAAELAAFCGCEEIVPEVLTKAFAYLSRISETTAASWRDVTVLMPAIKTGLVNQLGRKVADQRNLDQVVVLTVDHKTTVYGPQRLFPEELVLPKFRKLADTFGIDTVHFVAHERSHISRKQVAWQVSGIGGLASHALEKAPFNGTTAPNRKLAKVETVAVGEAARQSRRPHLFVQVLGSDPEDVAHTKLEIAGSPEFRYHHVINVRPMGYGTPRKSKASAQQVFRELDNADIIWFMTSHRLRQTGTPLNGMTGLQTASRTLSVAMRGLVACVGAKSDRDYFFEPLRNTHSAGAIAIWRHNPKVSSLDNVKRLIFNMLSQDVQLHTAESLRVMWPLKNQPIPAFDTVELGERRYHVEFVPAQQFGLNTTLVGYAVDVSFPRDAASEFQRFCADLFAGYGWYRSGNRANENIMQKGNEDLLVIPSTSDRDVAGALARSREEMSRCLVVTNRTVNKATAESAKKAKVDFIHYSELGRWLGAVYGDKLIGDP
ncbi:hypothetical protein LZK82_09915 [Rhizobium leguminosarum]|nr:hypothetical protein LZK82_09915 [Rhizobium leguminosarum]UIL29547.1 hypothetical protein LZK75_10075 [Rhizobium leguminosarum]